MAVIWSKTATYDAAPYESEADLEESILGVKDVLFGLGRIYLDVKRKIGAKNGTKNIPDGYLIDLTGKKPKLYVVENELAIHDPLRHIAVQILQFSLSFESEPRIVKQILFDALCVQSDAKRACEEFATTRDFRNLDHMLEWLVFEGDFTALVIIDSLPENLEKVLAERFKFGVEVLELARYRNPQGDYIYQFEPFLSDLRNDFSFTEGKTQAINVATSPSEIDTVVVPAREEGFQNVFLGENRWHSVRRHGSMRPQIKYIAAYRVAPESAITHIAPVRSIEAWRDTSKFVLNFAEPAESVPRIPLVEAGRVKALQNLRYTSRERILSAKSLDDIW